MSGSPSAEAAAADLRLVPPAAAAWLAALVVAHAPELVRPAATVAGALLAAAALAALAGAAHSLVRASCTPPGRATPSDGPTGGRCPLGRAARLVVLALAAAAAVLVAGGAQRATATPDVLVAAAARGDAVELVGRVVGDARAVTAGAASRERVTLDVTAVRVDGTWRAVAAPVSVIAPAGLPVDAVVRLRGTLAPSDRAGRAAVRLSARGTASVMTPPRAAQTWAQGVRAGARAVAAPLPPDVRGLLPAVTVGDTGGVPEDLTTAMRTAGLTHVTAVSGAHFAIVGALVLALAGALRAPLVVRAAAVATAGGLMLLVVGPQPSVIRAAVMGGVGLLGLVVGRRSVGPAALATAVVALLVADPWLGVDVGFGLSVAATAGLVLLSRPLVERIAPFCGRDAAGLLAAPVSAQLGCLPVALAVWPTFGPWAVLANLAVVPAIAPATVLGLLAALVAPVWAPGGTVLAAFAGAACWWVAGVARWVARLPAAGLAWWPGPVGAVSAAVVVLAVAALVRPRRA